MLLATTESKVESSTVNDKYHSDILVAGIVSIQRLITHLKVVMPLSKQQWLKTKREFF